MDFKNKNVKQKLLNLYDLYAHNKLNRREFVEKISVFAVGGLTVPAIMDYLLPKYQEREQTVKGDPRLNTETVGFPSPKGAGKMQGQLSRLKSSEKKFPGVIVVHENRGLNPHIADVGRRAALEGFISLSPDALFPLGGYPGTDDEGRTMQRKRDKNEMLEDFIAAFKYLKNHPECTGKVGVVGFCFGGWISNMMAVRCPELKAAVPFYGGQAPIEDVPNINAPLLLQFGELDSRVNAGWPEYEAALKKHGKDYEAHIYPEANHGFHNDTTPRYDEENARLAWKRTIDFFKEHLM
jgi:carboxymethylenebutenolidase